jgi:CRISPR/Cas system-associated exonuclease Cas4 (RecB family)
MSGANEPPEARPDRRGRVVDRLLNGDFEAWVRERRRADNLRDGRPQFNGPRPAPEPGQHSPSKLLQCHRKTVYQQRNAPAEERQPYGYYFFGSRVEEELLVEFLEDTVGDEAYVTEAMWIDFAAEADEGDLRFRGQTDPVVVDGEGAPLVPTEVKTSTAVANRDAPSDRHVAQVHAYLRGLSEERGERLTDAVLLYVDRETLELKTFHVEFDAGFWRDRVLDWAATHARYRDDGELPPAVPHAQWECDYCPFRRRCGRADDTEYRDTGPVGFLPLLEYPRGQVEQHVEAHDVRLTPLLARQFEELAAEWGAYDWHCPACGASHARDEVDWNGNPEQPPLCPSCLGGEGGGLPAPLRGPPPADQRESSGGDR